MKQYAKQCLHCANSCAGHCFIPRFGAETMHGTVPNDVAHFDFLYVRLSVAIGTGGFPEGAGFGNIFVMMDYLCYFIWLETTESCTVEVMARYLPQW